MRNKRERTNFGFFAAAAALAILFFFAWYCIGRRGGQQGNDHRVFTAGPALTESASDPSAVNINPPALLHYMPGSDTSLHPDPVGGLARQGSTRRVPVEISDMTAEPHKGKSSSILDEQDEAIIARRGSSLAVREFLLYTKDIERIESILAATPDSRISKARLQEEHEVNRRVLDTMTKNVRYLVRALTFEEARTILQETTWWSSVESDRLRGIFEPQGNNWGQSE
jgi:hypothetical protein